MPKVKDIKLQQNYNSGFTLMELMVVLVIMVMLATAMVINLAGQKAARNVKIAQNELVGNIRLAQSYTLSARTLSGGQSVQFYVLKFDLSKPTQYTLEAIYNVSSAPMLVDIQTINLPPNIQIATITPDTYPITIDRSAAGDAANQYPPPNQYLQTPTCAFLAYAAPFGKVIFDKGCNPLNPASMPYVIPSSDDSNDYEKIINFQNNVPCNSSGNPLSCSASTDSIMTITLSDTGKTVFKTVTINGITGSVIFN